MRPQKPSNSALFSPGGAPRKRAFGPAAQETFGPLTAAMPPRAFGPRSCRLLLQSGQLRKSL